MTSKTDTRTIPAERPQTLFKVDEPLHRPPDGYRLAAPATWDPNDVDPDEIDDN